MSRGMSTPLALLLALGCVSASGCAVDPAPGSNRCASDGSCPSGLRCYRPSGLGATEPGFCVGDGMDGGACVSSGTETCNGADDDCDGSIDEGLLGTSDNCSACGAGCGGANPDCVPNGTGGFMCGADCGFSMCASGCKDLMTDRSNCGACAVECDDREDCIAGSCTCGGVGADCDGTTVSTCCGTSCVDLNTSNAHCGGCGLACPSGATCAAQQCQCGTTANCRAPSRCVAGACL